MTLKQKKIFKLQLIALYPMCYISDPFTFKNKKDYNLFLKGVNVGYEFKRESKSLQYFETINPKDLSGEWGIYLGGLKERPCKFIKDFKNFKEAISYINNNRYYVSCVDVRKHQIYLVSTETKKIKKVSKKYFNK